MEQLVEQSTAIVRARVTGSYGQIHGSVVYTHYSIQVAEQYKGTAPAVSDVLTPGGTANGLRQEVAGAPQLTVGEEYVLFLWTGKSGATHLMGPQGVFSLDKASKTDPTATREASSELMLDRSTGRVVRDERLSLKLSELRTAVSSRVKGSAK